MLPPDRTSSLFRGRLTTKLVKSCLIRLSMIMPFHGYLNMPFVRILRLKKTKIRRHFCTRRGVRSKWNFSFSLLLFILIFNPKSFENSARQSWFVRQIRSTVIYCLQTWTNTLFFSSLPFVSSFLPRPEPMDGVSSEPDLPDAWPLHDHCRNLARWSSSVHQWISFANHTILCPWRNSIVLFTKDMGKRVVIRNFHEVRAKLRVEVIIAWVSC